jgi:membrane protein implicated in regulation of membrane protease activity
MVDGRAKSVGRYFLRLIGGVAVIAGLLAFFGTLTRGNLGAVIISVVLIAVGAFMVKKPGQPSRAGEPASTMPRPSQESR